MPTCRCLWRMPIIPVDQVTERDCFAACLASILELPLASIPDSARGPGWDKDATNRWAAFIGLSLVEVRLDLPEAAFWPVASGTLCILVGKSPRRDVRHAVVGRFNIFGGRYGFEILHDPHASRANFVGEALSVVFVSLLDPAKFLEAMGTDH